MTTLTRAAFAAFLLTAATIASSATAEVEDVLRARLGEPDADNIWRVTGEPKTSDSAPIMASDNAFAFDGEAGLEMLEMPANPAKHVGIEAWVRPSASNGARLIVRCGGDGGFGIEQFNEGVWGVIYGRATVGFHKLPLDTWSHVALVIHEDRSVLYVNGRDAGSADSVPWGYKAGEGAAIALNQGKETGGFEGSIDEVRLFTFEPDAFKPADLQRD